MTDETIRSRDLTATESVQAKLRAGEDVSYDEAIGMALEHVLAKWPEEDPEATRKWLCGQYRTRGLALNHAAHLDPSAPNEALAAQAARALTGNDKRSLQAGG